MHSHLLFVKDLNVIKKNVQLKIHIKYLKAPKVLYRNNSSFKFMVSKSLKALN